MIHICKYMLLPVLLLPFTVLASKCLYVSSYHKGYEWDDGILSGLRDTIDHKCELEVFYLDSKRNTDSSWVQWKARLALKKIDSFKPDVIIAADDNASRYLVEPYLKNGDIPVVFCGLNWTMDEYGYPYRNATGMVEIAPVKALIKQLRLLKPQIGNGVFLSSDTLSEHKDFDHYRSIFAENQITLKPVFVKSFRDWSKQYLDAQQYDFVFLGNNAGINDWYGSEAERIIGEYTRVISVSTYRWMLPYVAIAYTKSPEEQGRWAGKTALSILRGMTPQMIPVVYNRQWDLWLNTQIISRLGMSVPYSLEKRAKHY